MSGSQTIKFTSFYMMGAGAVLALMFLSDILTNISMLNMASMVIGQSFFMLKFSMFFNFICRAALPVLGFFAFKNFDNKAYMTKLMGMAGLLFIANIVALILYMIFFRIDLEIFNSAKGIGINIDLILILNTASICVLLFGIKKFLAEKQ